MNHNNITAALAARSNQSEDPARQLFLELKTAIQLARASIPVNKEIEVLCGPLRVIRFGIRRGGILAISGLSEENRFVLRLVHYTAADFTLVQVDKDKVRTVPKEIGFHTLFESPDSMT